MVLVCLAGGCRDTSKPIEALRHVAFDEAEYAPFENQGTGRITGQAFARTAGGDIRLASGLEVCLEPVTRYSAEWWDRSVIGREFLVACDSRLKRFQRSCVADAMGQFVFEALPAGEYYVHCEIRWRYVSGYVYQSPVESTAVVIVGMRTKLVESGTVRLVLPRVRGR